MRALLMPAVVAAVQITSPSHHDADQMKETFYSLAAAKDKNGGKLDDATKTEVERILDLVNGNLVAALWQDRDAAQSAYNSSVAAVNGCNSQLTDTLLPRYQQEIAITGSSYGAFTGCLGQENTICNERDTACDALDKYVCDWSVDMCNDNYLNTEGCTDCKEQDPTTTDLYATLNCLVDFDTKYYNTYMQMSDNCKRLRIQYTNKKNECDSLQSDLEAQKCTEQQTIANHCNLHDTCWTDNTNALGQTRTVTENLENIFQKQYTALQCLLCYGDQILQDLTDLSVCEAATPPTFACPDNAGHSQVPLAICYYEHDAKYDCEAEKDGNIPCTAGYYEEYYAPFDGTCAAVEVCNNACTIN